MAYQVIARKWRPQSFTELIGQNHISQTLVNALKNQRLPQALLFTGPRGTGKTSSARIFAKSLRCEKAENFVPCNECSSCVEITRGSSMDVIEIDGASNNGVDSIRELREGVAFMPSSGKYKIYIIDEVHMLSTSAFNALLKTLEEPPPHVVFMMATTEAHKIPQTILSRCQRFDFRRISTKQIMERLKFICEKDLIQAEDDALWIVAKQGDGSMRDAQSLLDQVVTFANGPLTKENIVQILGLTDRALLYESLHFIIERNAKGAISIIQKLLTSGVDPHLFSQELLEIIRNLLLVKVSEDQVSLILDLPDSEVAMLKEFSDRSREEDLHMLFDMALKGSSDISRAQDPRMVLEVVLLRMASAPRIKDLQTLISEAARGLHGDGLAHGVGEIHPPSMVGSSRGHGRLKESQKMREIPAGLEAMKRAVHQSGQVVSRKEAVTTPPVSEKSPKEKWIDFTERVRQQDALYGAKIENLYFVRDTEGVLRLGVPPNLGFLKEQMETPENRKKMQGYIDSFWGAGYAFEVVLERGFAEGESAQSMQKQRQQQAQEEIQAKIAEHPSVKNVQEVFKGTIKSVSEIKKS